MTVECAESVKIVLFCFSSHPLAKNVPSKSAIKKYYLMGGHEISRSRSLDMIGKISLVMWLHLNQSYSKNLSMWDIINHITIVFQGRACQGREWLHPYHTMDPSLLLQRDSVLGLVRMLIKPANSNHSRETEKDAVIGRWLLFKGF